MLKNERNLKSNRTDYDLVFLSGNRVTRRKVLHTFKRQEELTWRKDIEDESSGHHYGAGDECLKCKVHVLYAENYTVLCEGYPRKWDCDA